MGLIFTYVQSEWPGFLQHAKYFYDHWLFQLFNQQWYLGVSLAPILVLSYWAFTFPCLEQWFSSFFFWSISYKYIIDICQAVGEWVSSFISHFEFMNAFHWTSLMHDHHYLAKLLCDSVINVWLPHGHRLLRLFYQLGVNEPYLSMLLIRERVHIRHGQLYFTFDVFYGPVKREKVRISA